MDNDEEYLLFVGIFSFCLLMLLFTSYNFNDIPSLIIIYGIMIITGLSMFHALNSASYFIASSTE